MEPFQEKNEHDQVCEIEENSNCIVNDIQYVSAVQVFDPFTVKVSSTEEVQQEISNIDHLQSKHDASDLLASTCTAHKLEHCKKRCDIFERSDISLATIKNTNNFPADFDFLSDPIWRSLLYQ